MATTKGQTANIVVSEHLNNIFNLMKGALGCRTDELFEEILEFYLEHQFQTRLDERGQMFVSMIDRLRTEKEGPKEHKAEAEVEIQRERVV